MDLLTELDKSTSYGVIDCRLIGNIELESIRFACALHDAIYEFLSGENLTEEDIQNTFLFRRARQILYPPEGRNVEAARSD